MPARLFLAVDQPWVDWGWLSTHVPYVWDGVGYRRFARLVAVELPLAVPAIFAGLRVAVVSTIGIVTITAVIGLGGLGQLILRGLIQDFRTPLVVATALCIVIALFADLALAGAQRLVVPWGRSS